MNRPDTMLWLSDSRGVYIPRDFAQSLTDGDGKHSHVDGVSDDDWSILQAGPTFENEFYWEVWDNVLCDAVVTDENGVKYSLYQEGDLWLIPEGMVWNDHMDFYEYPTEEISDDRDMSAPYEP